MQQKNLSDHEQLENKISLLSEENSDLKEVLSKNDKKMPLMIESQLSRLCNVFQNFGTTIEKSSVAFKDEANIATSAVFSEQEIYELKNQIKNLERKHVIELETISERIRQEVKKHFQTEKEILELESQEREKTIQDLQLKILNIKISEEQIEIINQRVKDTESLLQVERKVKEALMVDKEVQNKEISSLKNVVIELHKKVEQSRLKALNAGF